MRSAIDRFQKIFLCSAIFFGVCSIQTKAASIVLEHPSVSIGVAGQASDLDKLAYAVALQKGFFNDEGLTVTSIDFGSGSKALHALVGENVDAVEGSYEHTIRMQAQGVSLTCMGVFAQFPGIVMLVPKSQAEKIKSVADLRGKKIGVSAPGSAMHTFAVGLMQRAGLKPNDASFVAVGTGATALAAVMTGGELDVLVTIDPVATELTQAAEAIILADSRTSSGAIAAYGGAYPAGCIYAPEKFLKANPKTAQALTNAMVRAMKWLQSTSIDEIIKVMPKTYYRDEAVYRAALAGNLDLFRWDGLVTPEMSRTVFNSIIILDPKLKDAKIDFDKTYDNSLTLHALEAVR